MVQLVASMGTKSVGESFLGKSKVSYTLKTISALAVSYCQAGSRDEGSPMVSSTIVPGFWTGPADAPLEEAAVVAVAADVAAVVAEAVPVAAIVAAGVPVAAEVAAPVAVAAEVAAPVAVAAVVAAPGGEATAGAVVEFACPPVLGTDDVGVAQAVTIIESKTTTEIVVIALLRNIDISTLLT